LTTVDGRSARPSCRPSHPPQTGLSRHRATERLTVPAEIGSYVLLTLGRLALSNSRHSIALTGMPTRAELCRLKAGECEALAAAVTDRDSREQLRGAARQWLELADQVELLERLSDKRGRHPRG